MAMKNRITTLILTGDRELGLRLKAHMMNLKTLPNDVTLATSVREARSEIQQRPSLVVVTLDESIDVGFATIQESLEARSDLFIVAAATDPEPETIVRAVRVGAADFLRLPAKEVDLRSIAGRAHQLESSQEQDTEHKGTIVSMFSNKGGTGTTALAINLAVALKQVSNGSAVIVDLVLQHGDVAAFLDMSPAYTIVDIIQNYDRLDAAFMRSSLTEHSSGIYLLAEPMHAEEAEMIQASQIGEILKLLRSMFDYVVIDCGNDFSEEVLMALDLSDTILLMTLLNLPSIRNTKRCLDIFRRLRYDQQKTKLVVNRYGAQEPEAMTLEAVESALKHPITWTIPNDYGLVIRSINQGEPVLKMDAKSPLSVRMIEIAASIGNIPIPHDASSASSPGLIQRLIGLWHGDESPMAQRNVDFVKEEETTHGTS